MNAQQTINAFLNGRSAKSSNLYSDGEKLWSYSTVIAQFITGVGLVVNGTKYSSTTTRRVNQLLRSTRAAQVIEGVIIPRNTYDLGKYAK